MLLLISFSFLLRERIVSYSDSVQRGTHGHQDRLFIAGDPQPRLGGLACFQRDIWIASCKSYNLRTDYLPLFEYPIRKPKVEEVRSRVRGKSRLQREGRLRVRKVEKRALTSNSYSS